MVNLAVGPGSAQNDCVSARFLAVLFTVASAASYCQPLLSDSAAGNLPAPTSTITPSTLPLHDGTPVRLRLTRDLSYATVKPDDRVHFEIMDDLRIDGMQVLARGSKVITTAVVAEPKTKMRKGGKLGVTVDSIHVMSGDNVPVRLTQAARLAATATPTAPIMLLTFGKEDSLPAGTIVTTYVDGDFTLDAGKFLVDITFSSYPQGAMVTMYGARLGRTPFTTKLARGAYRATFSVEGYADMSKSLEVGPGQPNTVDAEFELLKRK